MFHSYNKDLKLNRWLDENIKDLAVVFLFFCNNNQLNDRLRLPKVLLPLQVDTLGLVLQAETSDS